MKLKWNIQKFRFKQVTFERLTNKKNPENKTILQSNNIQNKLNLFEFVSLPFCTVQKRLFLIIEITLSALK